MNVPNRHVVWIWLTALLLVVGLPTYGQSSSTKPPVPPASVVSTDDVEVEDATKTTTTKVAAAAATADAKVDAALLAAGEEAGETAEGAATDDEPNSWELEGLDNPANVAWTMMAAALVMFMQAGFALLEAGMARSKNTVNVLMKNYTDMAFGTLVYWLVGFGFMFGTSYKGWGWIGMTSFAPSSLEAGSTNAFIIFQVMFAATAATIVSGAIAERTKYWSYLLNATFLTAFIYPVFGHWAWGSLFGPSKGWLENMGFIDFAGSTVVHSMGGWCALAALLVIGPRLGRFGSKGEVREIPGHNLMMVALGGFILWFGWFGFNAGSTNSADASIGTIMLNTQLAACAGVVGAITYLGITGRNVLLTGSVNGGLAGLVAITAGCANLSPFWSVITGLLAGAIVIIAGDLILKMKIDDVVGAVSVHGVCGAWGTLCAGMFDQSEHLFSWSKIFPQLVGIVACFVWGFGLSFIMYKLTAIFLGARASTMHEQRGLDYTEHSEVGYPEFDPTLLHADEEV